MIVGNSHISLPLTRSYATWNPNVLKINTARTTLSNGNLTMAHVASSGGDSAVISTIAMASDKYFWEITIGTATSLTSVAVGTDGHQLFDMPGRNSIEYAYLQNGNKMNGGVQTAYGATYTAGDVIGVALDLVAQTVVFYKNGSSQGTAFSGLTSVYWAMIGSSDATPVTTLTANFGASSFSFSVPAGFRSGIYIN